jgi:hypothetical protein
MATTTNYGWTTPDDTALVKDGASAIRTLGSSVDTTTKNLNPETTLGDLSFRSSTSNVNTRIPIGSSGQHLTVVAGVPAWATASDQTPLTTKGDLFTFSTVDARLGVGTNNHVLTADSAEATGLKWAAPAGGGKVLQVVSATTATSTSIITATYTDTTITATITPTSATSKILVLASSIAYLYRTTGNEFGAGARLLRGATVLYTNQNSMGIGGENVGGKSLSNMNSWVYLDSPATTSATTYKIQAKTDGTAEVRFQVSSDTSVITLLEIGA